METLLNKKQLATIDRWHKVAKQLSSLRAEEKELRLNILGDIFNHKPDRETRDSAEHYMIMPGFSLTADFKQSMKIETGNKDFKECLVQISEDDLNEAVKFNPNLSVSGYKKLSIKDRRLIDRCITKKPGLPGLKLVVPKK